MATRNRLAGMIGNLLEHYDNALFGLLAPFISPLFFENKDPLTALILTYFMIPMGLLTRPFGSLFFGWIGDKWGRRSSLCASLFGMAIVTMGIGFLPVYKDIGIWAPIWLAVARMLQSFFAAGELVGGAIFVLEHTPDKKRGFMSSWYTSSSMGGVLLASFLVMLMSQNGLILEGWRILYWFGGVSALCGIFLRFRSSESAEYVKSSGDSLGLKSLKEYKGAFLNIFLASGFCYTTYSLAFTLMNGYIPLITNLSKAQVMQVNTVLLLFDLFLLPCFGYLASRIGKEKVMLTGAIFLAIFAIPLFSLLNHANLATVIGVRIAIIIFGVAFSAPYYAWAIEQVPPRHRYLILSLGGALGSQLIGTPTSAISLWLYKSLGWSGAPALYLLVAGSLAAWVVARSRKPIPALR